MTDGTPAVAPLIGVGQVRHERLRPVPNRFAYPTYFLMLPMRRLREAPFAALNRNRFGLVSFHDRDHGDGRGDSLAWLDDTLAANGVRDADGEVWLHCYPRVLGHTFKPVSFWYCHRRDASLAAILVEVNNTFGERHVYLLRGEGLASGREIRADKAFYVSPFCGVDGDYRFRFLRVEAHPGGADARRQTTRAFPRTVVRIDLHDTAGPLIRTSVCGELRPLTARRIAAAFVAMPWLTAGVVARIHWQALKLWVKRVPLVRKPAAPAEFITR